MPLAEAPTLTSRPSHQAWPRSQSTVSLPSCKPPQPSQTKARASPCDAPRPRTSWMATAIPLASKSAIAAEGSINDSLPDRLP
ncbi:MAG: hypothetical protein BWZ10_00001 [candidate division BRC1 bacterium ADurb.BinA364]|nr:MAG: hypothetical protein BWZ10_00001 [candidate division BRC1 bacterium ADurb.BinA364]